MSPPSEAARAMMYGFEDHDPFEVLLVRAKDMHKQEVGMLKGAVQRLQGVLAEYEAKFRTIHSATVRAAIDEPEMAANIKSMAEEMDAFLRELGPAAHITIAGEQATMWATTCPPVMPVLGTSLCDTEGNSTPRRSGRLGRLDREPLLQPLQLPVGQGRGLITPGSRSRSASVSSTTPRIQDVHTGRPQPLNGPEPGSSTARGGGSPSPQQAPQSARSPGARSPGARSPGASKRPPMLPALQGSRAPPRPVGEDGRGPQPSVVGNGWATPTPGSPISSSRSRVDAALFLRFQQVDPPLQKTAEEGPEKGHRSIGTKEDPHVSLLDQQTEPEVAEAAVAAGTVAITGQRRSSSINSSMNSANNSSLPNGRPSELSVPNEHAARRAALRTSLHSGVRPAADRTSIAIAEEAKIIMEECQKEKAEVHAECHKISKRKKFRKVAESDEEKGFLRRIVESTKFDFLCATMILANSALIGFEVQWLTENDEETVGMKAFGYFCSFFFLVELALRMAADGVFNFFSSENWNWNIFDFTLVVMSVIDFLIVTLVSEPGGASSISTSLKTIKMLRIVRMCRVFRFFQELSQLALMIIDSVKSLTWALLMLGIINFTSAICFTFYASDHIKAMNIGSEQPIAMYFGTLPLSCYTLFHSMLNGVSWHVIADELFLVHWALGLLYLMYMSFTMLAVLNIITGVFVDNAVETARTQREFLVQKEMEMKERWLAEMRALFDEMDTDGSGTVSLAEVQSFFADPRVQSYFQALGLDATDAQRLFSLLDEDGSGDLSVGEFLNGCLRLKGVARSIDVYTLMFEHKKSHRTMVRGFEDLEVILNKETPEADLAREKDWGN